MAAKPGDESRAVLEPGELAAMLGPGGAVSRVLPGFEQRPEQVAMIEATAEAFCEDRVLLVEAGTGVGKSLAYGLPAALWARRTGRRVVISTGTINLQEQLVGKDLPLVGAALGCRIDFVLVKGRGNYLCRRRLADRTRQRLLVQQDEHDGLFEALAEWAESDRSTDGSRSDLSMAVPDETWELVCSDADACLGRRCVLRDDCFFARARRAAEKAQLLVVNHHLLFADLALRFEMDAYKRRAVLPPFERVVLDEGHVIEDVASSFFGVRLTRLGVLRSLGRLSPASRSRGGGLLAEMAARSAGSSTLGAGLGPRAASQGPLVQKVDETRQAFERAFDAISDLAERHTGRSGTSERRLRLTPGLFAGAGWTAVKEGFSEAARKTVELMSEIERLVDRLELLSEEEGRAAEARASVRRLLNMANACRHLTDEGHDEDVRWVELPARAGGRFVKLAAAPLQVADRLEQALFGQMETVVITSATLSVGGSFDHLARRLGVDRLDQDRRRTLQLHSPFDYARQARLGVPRDAPAPTEPAFEDWLPEAVFRLAAASRGGALVLFTAWGLMTRAFELVRDRLEELGIEPLCQGQAPRDKLLRRFRENESSVLFGTDSFWQGVDVIGPALRQVIITRLPFDVPSEPLIQARAEQIQAQGRSPFSDFSLPRAVLKLKQGFGRLIRSGQDTGAVVILDSRITARSYGRRFMASLPPVGFVDGTLDEVCDQLAEFFAAGSG